MRRFTRNPWLLLTGALLLALLLVPAALLARAWMQNSALAAQISDARQQLSALSAQRPFPSPTNIARLRAATAEAEALLVTARGQFQPLPTNGLTGRDFVKDLQNRLAALSEQARRADLRLPSKNYGFTLSPQRIQEPSTPEAAAALSQTLAQIEWLCGTVLEAHCDLLELRRPRLPGEPASRRSDITHRNITTNTVARAVLVPYRVTVECSTAELSEVLERFANAPHGVIARVLMVERGNRTPQTDRPAGSPAKARPVSNHPSLQNTVKATLQLDFVTSLD